MLYHSFRFLIFIFSFLCGGIAFSQELFPTLESASPMPKKVGGYRQINEMYNDINNRSRYYFGFRLMYGLTKNLTVMTMVGGSNHHFRRIPSNLTYYILNHHRRGFPVNPFLTEGVHFYAKYRFINIDRPQKHFRIAGYSEANKAFVAHTEAEPSLMTDNSGYGGGFIITKLHKRFAASFTWGFVKSFPYYQDYNSITIEFVPGNATLYNVGFGYRLYPKAYNSYKDINVNLYAEFINKDYSAAKITYLGFPYNYEYLNGIATYTYNSFTGGQYSEMRSSIQFIFNSESRLDIGVAAPVYGRSYLHDYPLIYINVQKYFFH